MKAEMLKKAKTLTVYHGSSEKFDAFQSGRTLHFTDSYAVAKSYAIGYYGTGTGYVYTVQLEMDNPIDIRKPGESERILEETGEWIDADAILDPEALAELDLGMEYDGIIAYSEVGGGMRDGSTEYIVWDAGQADITKVDVIHPSKTASVTDSPTFKAWFSGSKVVDGSGNPQMVFHGTLDDFDEFRNGDIGFHVGTNEQAETRISIRQMSRPEEQMNATGYGHVMPLYACIKNPLKMRDLGNWDDPWEVYNMAKKYTKGELDGVAEKISAALWEGYVKGPNQEEETALRHAKNSPAALSVIRDQMIKAGYDGIQYENEYEGKGTSWICFKPNQVKSAIGNDGSFDANSNSITAAITPEDRTLYHGTDSEHEFDSIKPFSPPSGDPFIWLGELDTAKDLYSKTIYGEGRSRVYEVKLKHSAKLADLRDPNDEIYLLLVAYLIKEKGWKENSDWVWSHTYSAVHYTEKWLIPTLKEHGYSGVIVNDAARSVTERKLRKHHSVGICDMSAIESQHEVKTASRPSAQEIFQSCLDAEGNTDNPYSGDCGTFAIAACAALRAGGYNPSLVLYFSWGSESTIEEVMKDKRAELYHVAVEVEGQLFDSEGLTSDDQIREHTYESYNDFKPSIIRGVNPQDPKAVNLILKKTEVYNKPEEYLELFEEFGIKTASTIGPVYHGTTYDFDTFKKNKGLRSGFLGSVMEVDVQAFFFTEDKRQAMAYAKNRKLHTKQPTRVITAYLTINHLLDLTDSNWINTPITTPPLPLHKSEEKHTEYIYEDYADELETTEGLLDYIVNYLLADDMSKEDWYDLSIDPCARPDCKPILEEGFRAWDLFDNKKVSDALRYLGYDGFKVPEGEDAEFGGTSWAVMSATQVRIVSNKEAKIAGDSSIYWHGSHNKFSEFEHRSKALVTHEAVDQPIFLSPDRSFARLHAGRDGYLYEVKANVANTFDGTSLINPAERYYMDPATYTELGKKVYEAIASDEIWPDGSDDPEGYIKALLNRQWDTQGSPEFLRWLKAEGFDSYIENGDGPDNLAVLDASKLEIIGTESFGVHSQIDKTSSDVHPKIAKTARVPMLFCPACATGTPKADKDAEGNQVCSNCANVFAPGEAISMDEAESVHKAKIAARTVPADEFQTPDITPEMTPAMKEWFKGSLALVFWDDKAKGVIENTGKFAAARGIYFHGTSYKNLRSILTQGLIPDVRERNFGEDTQSGVNRPSISSYGGIYFSQNFMTAYGSPKDHYELGREIMVCAELQPNTFYLDEDNIVGALNGALGRLSDHQFSVGVTYILAKYGEDHQMVDVDQAHASFIEDAKRRITYMIGEAEITLHPGLEKRIDSLLDDMWFVSLARLAAHHYKDKGYYGIGRAWSQVMGDKPMPPEEEIIPTVAEAEADFRKHADQFTKTLKTLLKPDAEGNQHSRYMHARVMDPVGYSGSNHITAVIEIQDGDKLIGRGEPARLIVHYGEIPQSFLKGWKQFRGGEYVVEKAGGKMASTSDDLVSCAKKARSKFIGNRPAQNGDCVSIAYKLVDLLNAQGIEASSKFGYYKGISHFWVQVGDTYIDPTHDQFSAPAIRIGEVTDSDYISDYEPRNGIGWKSGSQSPQEIGKIVKRWCKTEDSYNILDSISDGTWTAGGCWVLAAAVQKAFGGDLYVVLGQESGRERIGAQHVVVALGDYYIDGDGATPKTSFAKQWGDMERVKVKVIVPITPELEADLKKGGVTSPALTCEIAEALHPGKQKVAKDFGYSQYNDREEELGLVEFNVDTSDEYEVAVQAKLGGKYVGSLVLLPSEVNGETGWGPTTVLIDDEWRGTGLGQMLYDEAIKWVRDTGAVWFTSDDTLSDAAHKAWNRLSQRYPVEKAKEGYRIHLNKLGGKTASMKTARPTDQKIKLLAEQMKLTPEQIEQVIATDPSPNQTDFITWIAKNVSKGKIRLPEDSERIKGQLESFMKAKRSPGFTGNKDINGYTPETLFATVGNQEAVPVSNKEKDRQTIAAGSKVIVTYDDVTIYKVTDAKALSLLSSGTNWCTAQESTGANYLKQGPSYVIFEEGSAFGQLHPSSDQFMDRSDVSFHDTLPPVSKQISYSGNNDEPSFIIDPTARMAVQKLAELEPEVAKWFKQYDLPEDQLRGMLQQGAVGTSRSLQLAMLNKTPLPKEVEDQFPRSKEVDFMLVTKYGMMFHKGKPWKPLEIMLLDLQSPVHEMLTYARRFMNGNWPDGDVKVLSNCLGDQQGWNEQRWNDFALEWSKGVKGGSWPQLEDKIRNKAKRRGEAGAFALRYCLDVTGKRWPTVEGDGVENSMLEERGMEVATKYAPQFIHEPWPELKEKLVAMMDRRYELSSEVLGALVLYAKDVSRQREPDFENVFLAPDVNSEKIADYIRDVIKGRWPEYEEKLTKLAVRLMDGYYFNSSEAKPISAYMKGLKTRLPGVEKLIKEQVSHPVEGGKLISTIDARDWCMEYCEVAKEAGAPWSEGWEMATSRSPEIEQGIMDSMKTDLVTARFTLAAYIKQLIKGGHEWPEGEKIIREGAERNIGRLQSLVDRLDERDAKKQKPVTAKIASHRDRLHYGYKMAVAEGWFSDEPQVGGQQVTRIEMLKPHLVEEVYDHEKHANLISDARIAGCDGVAFKDLKVKLT